MDAELLPRLQLHATFSSTMACEGSIEGSESLSCERQVKYLTIPDINTSDIYPTLLLYIYQIPFTSLQFPLYEYLKVRTARARGKDLVGAHEAAVCGSIAGGVAAALTTPLDVLKTRTMLDLRVRPLLSFPSPFSSLFLFTQVELIWCLVPYLSLRALSSIHRTMLALPC